MRRLSLEEENNINILIKINIKKIVQLIRETFLMITIIIDFVSLERTAIFVLKVVVNVTSYKILLY